MRLPVLGGPLRGMWWDPRSGGKVARVLGGTYEREQTGLFQRVLRPGQTVLDVGAHVGYYTLLASRLVGANGSVWSLEPYPPNARFLRRHVEINGCGNVRVEEVAASDGDGVLEFARGSGSGTGRLQVGGGLQVRTVRLDDFCAERGIEPSAMKIDVEGAEISVLDGARGLLADARPVLFLSTHGADVHEAALRFLDEVGYDAAPIDAAEVERATELLCRPGG